MNILHTNASVLAEAIEEIKHFLPSQAPLKDFVHHNTLHAFQDLEFFEANRKAHDLLGYKTLSNLSEYKNWYEKGNIQFETILRTVETEKGKENCRFWINAMLNTMDELDTPSQIGQLRPQWKKKYKIDLDQLVHPTLFKIIGAYFDQGISNWKFPVHEEGFLYSLRQLEKKSYRSMFKTKQARALFLDENADLSTVLQHLVGDEKLYKNYLFDQQFMHPGWSGMVAQIERAPQGFIQKRTISFTDFLFFENLLEWDQLQYIFGKEFKPIGVFATSVRKIGAYANVKITDEIKRLWQLAYEWSYYNEVLVGLHENRKQKTEESFGYQAFFCMDDRECSIRRNLESVFPEVQTFGTPGHFNLELSYQPKDSLLYTKSCPAPATPLFLIQEQEVSNKKKTDYNYSKSAHNLLTGWVFTHVHGFISGFKMLVNTYQPTENSASVSSFKHMHPESTLSYIFTGEYKDNLQIGLSIDQAADRIAGVFQTTGSTTDFQPLVYIIGHGSSSANNTHYAGYDCGACCGRPGSVNARVFAKFANMKKVRQLLIEKHNINIPASTWFVGGLHDTARDDVQFYDMENLPENLKDLHLIFEKNMYLALDLTAEERSRRMESINSEHSLPQIHKNIRRRTKSMFEPRPELNHSNNTLTIIGRRALTRHLFLDRRSFLNSYDYQTDPEGTDLAKVLGAASGVVGGINMEYYYSRLDNDNLGAGTKLPHNVIGLFGVANGVDTDLRTGLPSQMIEVHDPLRMMLVVEHYPSVILSMLKNNPGIFNWYKNGWIQMVAMDPESTCFYALKGERFEMLELAPVPIAQIDDFESFICSSLHNLPVSIIA